MTNKWRWIFFIWHNWRAAVWEAEIALYPVKTCGSLISTPLRRLRAEILRDFHQGHARGLQHELFPPVPMTDADWKRLMRTK